MGLHFLMRTDVLSLCYIGAAVTNVGLNIVFVPRFGVMSTAVVTLASYAVLLAATAATSRRLFPWTFPLAATTRIAAAAAAMGFVVWAATRGISSSALQLAVGVPLGALTYPGAVYLFGALRPHELAWLSRILGFKR
jgi:O-antigen/teichoic acid export membrane protein